MILFEKLTKFSLTAQMAKNCKSMYEFGSVSISVFVISDGYEAKRGGEKEDLPSMSSLWLKKLWSFRINVKIDKFGQESFLVSLGITVKVNKDFKCTVLKKANYQNT